jgi:FtsH-binding integral membrane protein
MTDKKVFDLGTIILAIIIIGLIPWAYVNLNLIYSLGVIPFTLAILYFTLKIYRLRVGHKLKRGGTASERVKKKKRRKNRDS